MIRIRIRIRPFRKSKIRIRIRIRPFLKVRFGFGFGFANLLKYDSDSGFLKSKLWIQIRRLVLKSTISVQITGSHPQYVGLRLQAEAGRCSVQVQNFLERVCVRERIKNKCDTAGMRYYISCCRSVCNYNSMLSRCGSQNLQVWLKLLCRVKNSKQYLDSIWVITSVFIKAPLGCL